MFFLFLNHGRRTHLQHPSRIANAAAIHRPITDVPLDLRQVASVGVIADERGPQTRGVAAAIARLAFIAFAIFDDIRGVARRTADGFKNHEQKGDIGTLHSLS